MPSVTDVVTAWLSSDQPAVVFDFNGTLSNDEHILFDIFSELFQAHLGWAMTAEEYRDELLGRSDREIIEYAVARHGRGTDEEVTELLRLRQGAYKQRVTVENPIVDATVELVKLLVDNDFPLAIGTGAQRATTCSPSCTAIRSAGCSARWSPKRTSARESRTPRVF